MAAEWQVAFASNVQGNFNIKVAPSEIKTLSDFGLSNCCH